MFVTITTIVSKFGSTRQLLAYRAWDLDSFMSHME